MYVIKCNFHTFLTVKSQEVLKFKIITGQTSTVKPAVAATSIKRDPPLSGHFRAPRMILNANAPFLSVHLSNAASGRRNSPQNTEIVSPNGQFLSVDAASFD